MSVVRSANKIILGFGIVCGLWTLADYTSSLLSSRGSENPSQDVESVRITPEYLKAEHNCKIEMTNFRGLPLSERAGFVFSLNDCIQTNQQDKSYLPTKEG